MIFLCFGRKKIIKVEKQCSSQKGPFLTKPKTPSKTPQITFLNSQPMQIRVADRLIVFVMCLMAFKWCF